MMKPLVIVCVVSSVRRVPPHFSILPESTEVVEGGAVNLTCVAVGSPMPYVRWRRGSVDVPSVTGQRDAPTPIGKNVLQLSDVRQTATYTCVASSELGSIEHRAEVRVRGERDDLEPSRDSVHNRGSRFIDCDCAKS